MKTASVIPTTAVFASTSYSGGGSNYIVVDETTNYSYLSLIRTTAIFIFKSTNNGLTYGGLTLISGTFNRMALWYTRWSGIANNLVHYAYVKNDHKVYYRALDLSTGTFGTEYTVFTGVSTANDYPGLSITVSRGGNIIVAGCIDNGAEPFACKSIDAGVNWTTISAVYEASADQLALLPGWGADNQDIMCVYYDNSANELSLKLYDDSGDSWSESSIALSITFPATSSSCPHFSVCTDLANSQNLLVAWSAVDTANADLRCWKLTQSTITETTNVITNSTDDQGLCSIGINSSGHWYVTYAGKSDGSQTFNSDCGLCYKISNDGGITWSSEIYVSSTSVYYYNIISCPKIINLIAAHVSSSLNGNIVMCELGAYNEPKTTYQLGL